jgi:hypothetical protein
MFMFTYSACSQAVLRISADFAAILGGHGKP